MRHAEPLSPVDWRGSDDSRPLSPHGLHSLEKALGGMRKDHFRPTYVMTSPLERARQTAQKMSELNEGLRPIVRPELTSGARTGVIRKVLESVKNKTSVLIVGHMPDLAVFAAGLASEPYLMEQGQRPGEIWAVETGAFQSGWGTGKILWKRKLEEWN